jgi:hypothetical protein
MSAVSLAALVADGHSAGQHVPPLAIRPQQSQGHVAVRLSKRGRAEERQVLRVNRRVVWVIASHLCIVFQPDRAGPRRSKQALGRGVGQHDLPALVGDQDSLGGAVDNGLQAGALLR